MATDFFRGIRQQQAEDANKYDEAANLITGGIIGGFEAKDTARQSKQKQRLEAIKSLGQYAKDIGLGINANITEQIGRSLLGEIGMEPLPQQAQAAPAQPEFETAGGIQGLIASSAQIQPGVPVAQPQQTPVAQDILQPANVTAQKPPQTQPESQIFTPPSPKNMTPKDKATLGNTLRSQHASNPITKDTAARIGSFQAISSAYKLGSKGSDSQKAAADISLIFAFMKMLDPGSTVREGEFANAQNSAGVPDQVRNMWNRIVTGGRLNKEQRDAFFNQAQDLVDTQLQLQSNLDSQFSQIITNNGLEPGNVLLDLGALGKIGRQQLFTEKDKSTQKILKTSTKDVEELDAGELKIQNGWIYEKQPDGSMKPLRRAN